VTILIEDTVRNNLVTWTLEALERDLCGGAVLNPFASPVTGNGYKQAAQTTVQRLSAQGADVWFDPLTHALQMPAVGDFRYYDEWDLWGGAVGDLGTDAARRDHVRRVFEIQDRLGSSHLAPTQLLHTAESTTSQTTLELSEVAVEADQTCRLAIAGDTSFWASGSALDAHVGALAQLEPASWSLVYAHPYSVLPVPADERAIEGLCRTTLSLQAYGPVHISHGDLPGLPAAAAGASSLGTGWDPRQRVCAYASFSARESGGDGGQWFQQVTFQGLLSLLPGREAAILFTADRGLAQRLLAGSAIPPGPKERFLHHIEVLNDVMDGLPIDRRAAHLQLADIYDQAIVNWALVNSAAGLRDGAPSWVEPLQRGLRRFGEAEGW
jgi:hypothetical protein